MDGQTSSLPPLTEGLKGATRDELAHAYREMLRIRRFEENATRAYTRGKISGFLHLYIGQEAIAVGTNLAMRDGDRIVATYRDHGFALAQGCDPGARAGRVVRQARRAGRGRRLHALLRQGQGHVGRMRHHRNRAPRRGSRLPDKYLGDGVRSVSSATAPWSIGPTHEGMTLAGLWDLPVVFVVENNRYSMGTPLGRTLPVEDITLRAQGYGMESDRFEVTDPFQVRDRIGAAIERARKESRPTLVELLTYRFRGHSMSDPGKYRTKAELDDFRSRDPMEMTRRALARCTASAMTGEGVDDVVNEMDAATAFADASQPTRSTGSGHLRGGRPMAVMRRRRSERRCGGDAPG